MLCSRFIVFVCDNESSAFENIFFWVYQQSKIKVDRVELGVKLRKKVNRMRTRFDSKSWLNIAILLYSMAQILLDTKRQMRQIRARL